MVSPAAQETSSLPPASQGYDLEPGVILRAYQYTFPEKIKSVVYSGGEWIINGEDRSFAWAHGRILPLEKKDQWASFRPYSFEIYPRELFDPKDYSPEEAAEIRAQVAREENYGSLDYENSFRAFLYGGGNRAELEARLVRVRFLGRDATVHREIRDALARIDSALTRESAGDAELKRFLDSLAPIGAYNWRAVRGGRGLSYHSWGLALDLQNRQGEGAVYWQWERERNPDWMFIPLERRWQPPKKVIRAFENEGFIWGGKWLFFDTMHFEYRPELHEINRLLAAREGDFRIVTPRNDAGIHHIIPQVIER
ncbi:MAG: M15 family metallopeptidase [Spirochaetaceae bacterium]|nr:M15 family metallopeptidase [Spirochaetaceae bacterium]